MARVKIKVERGNGLQQVVTIDTAATEGATIGKNVYNPDGTLYVPASGGASANIRNGYGILISGTNPKTINVNRSANFDWRGQHAWEKPLWVPDGTAALPGVAFGPDHEDGLYRIGANNIGVATDGALRWDVDTQRTFQTVPLIVRTPDGQSAFFQNSLEPNAGVEIRSTYHALGTDIELSFWENNSGSNLDHRFRWFLNGAPASEAYFSLYRHDGSPTGNEILRFTRTTAGGDWLEQLRVSDGAIGSPSLAFTNNPALGVSRGGLGSDSFVVNIDVATDVNSAFEVRAPSATGATFTRIVAVGNTSTSRSTFQHRNNVGDIVAGFNYQRTTNAGYTNLASVVAHNGIAFNPGSTDANAPTFAWYMAPEGNFTALDTLELRLGTGGDLRLFHNGTNSTIRNDTGNLSINSGTTEVLRFIQGANARVHALNGTAALPTFGWFGDPDNGLYYITTNSFGISTAGTLRYQFGAAGQLGIGGANYGTANTQAIVSGGASAAPSWQTVLVDGQTQTLGGDKTWTGLHTFNGGMAGNASGLTNLNASNISSGTLSDSRLSSNVALKNAANIFTQMQRIEYTGSGEQLRLINDNAYLSFFNAANTSRSGYLWMPAGSSSQLWVEANQALEIGTNNTTRMTIGAAGNVSINAPSSGTALTVSGGLTLSSGALTLPAASIADAALSSNVPLKNAASNSFTGDVTVGGTISGSGAGITGVVHTTGTETIGGSKTFTSSVNVRGDAAHGFVAVAIGGVSNTGYIAFHAPGGTRQGYIGWSSSSASNDAGTIPYVAGTHAFTGTITGNGSGLTNLNAGNLSSGTIPDARFPATLPAISGASLTNLNASNLTSGTLPDGRFPATLPAASGVNLTALNASNISSGTLNDARLSSNVPLLNAANTFTAATNSTTAPALRIGGTGTTDAGYQLSVLGLGTNNAFGLRDTLNNQEFRIGAESAGGGYAVGTYTNHALRLLTNNTTRMRIGAAGDVTINGLQNFANDAAAAAGGIAVNQLYRNGSVVMIRVS